MSELSPDFLIPKSKKMEKEVFSHHPQPNLTFNNEEVL